MYICSNCKREFDHYNSQHGSFEVIEGKIFFSICKGQVVYFPDIETDNNEKDSICKR